MGFWTAIAIIAVVAIGSEFIVRIVKICTKHVENVERIKYGYPTLDGSKSARPAAEAHTPPERLQ
jgi:hypothetical protein